MAIKLGRFGKLVRQYEKARRAYPGEVFRYLKTFLPSKPLILDLGCGTGISTRQLSKYYGGLIGCDPDSLMLKAACRHLKVGNEKYIKGVASKLPFPNNYFDAVTAFQAFHWFNDRRSIKEIKRILKPGGIIFIVNKVGTKKWGEGYRQAIMRSTGEKVAEFRYNTYDPKRSLMENGFGKLRRKSWKKSEVFTLRNALEYVQSVSIWNSVKPRSRVAALLGLTDYFRRVKQAQGKIERKLTVSAIVGLKL